jgi:hypothetical protein
MIQARQMCHGTKMFIARALMPRSPVSQPPLADPDHQKRLLTLLDELERSAMTNIDNQAKAGALHTPASVYKTTGLTITCISLCAMLRFTPEQELIVVNLPVTHGNLLMRMFDFVAGNDKAEKTMDDFQDGSFLSRAAHANILNYLDFIDSVSSDGYMDRGLASGTALMTMTVLVELETIFKDAGVLNVEENSRT